MSTGSVSSLSSLIYFVPSAAPGEPGTIWEISVNGGEPRRVAAALGGGDISHDGKRIALFRFEEKAIALVLITRDGSGTQEVKHVPPNSQYDYPRWSPDDRWIAFQQDDLTGFNKAVFAVSSAPGGDLQEIARGADLGGLSWLPTGSGVVYSSSSGSTVLYPPVFNLRAVERDGTGDRQLTFGDVSYREPDVHASGTLTATRSRMQSDIWKFPVSGSPAENTLAGVRITHQTGQAQTPSVSPDESEVVYLSDSGGHGNLWIARTDGSAVRQLTFEQDPAISVGVPVWSPAGDEIVFLHTQGGTNSQSLINRDGSGRRRFVPFGIAASWSTDGRWVYYSRTKDDTRCIEKAAIAGEPVISVRCDNAVAPAPTPGGSALYFANYLTTTNGIVDYEIRRAGPENGPSELLARVAGSRVPVSRRLFTPVLSPNGKWLMMPLTDGATSNVWVLPTNGEPMRPRDRLRRSLGRDRPPRFMVARQPVFLRRRGRHGFRHRPTGWPAPMTAMPFMRRTFRTWRALPLRTGIAGGPRWSASRGDRWNPTTPRQIRNSITSGTSAADTREARSSRLRRGRVRPRRRSLSANHRNRDVRRSSRDAEDSYACRPVRIRARPHRSASAPGRPRTYRALMPPRRPWTKAPDDSCIPRKRPSEWRLELDSQPRRNPAADEHAAIPGRATKRLGIRVTLCERGERAAGVNRPVLLRLARRSQTHEHKKGNCCATTHDHASLGMKCYPCVRHNGTCRVVVRACFARLEFGGWLSSRWHRPVVKALLLIPDAALPPAFLTSFTLTARRPDRRSLAWCRQRRTSCTAVALKRGMSQPPCNGSRRTKQSDTSLRQDVTISLHPDRLLFTRRDIG